MDPEGYDQDAWNDILNSVPPVQYKHLPVGNVKIFVWDSATGLLFDTARSDPQGYYTIEKLLPEGTYIITAESPQKEVVRYGNNNEFFISGLDANKAIEHSVDKRINSNNRYSMWIEAGDVDESRTVSNYLNGITGLDANQIINVSVEKENYFKSNQDDSYLPAWVYSTDTIRVNSDTTFMVRGIMRGDVNRNYNGNDQLTSLPQIQRSARNSRRDIELHGYVEALESDRIISLPIVALTEGTLTSFQMALPYSNAEIINVETPNIDKKVFAYNPNRRGESVVMFLWATGSETAQNYNIGDTLAIVTIKVSRSLRGNPNRYLQNETSLYEAAYGQKVLDFKVGIPEIEIYYMDDTTGVVYDTMTKPEEKQSESETEVNVHGNRGTTRIVAIVPNPAVGTTDVTYNIDGSSIVTLQLYDMLGKLHRTVVYAQRQSGLYRRQVNLEGLAAGTYILRLESTMGDGNSIISVERIIVKK